MTKVIIVKRNDGYISVANLADDNLTDEKLNIVGNELLTHIDGAVSYRITDSSEMPSNDEDHEFFNAYQDTGSIVIDMAKANEIKRDKFRILRKPILDALDVDYMRADEAGNADLKEAIKQKKQALRNVTSFEDIQDVNQLKNFLPSILNV